MHIECCMFFSIQLEKVDSNIPEKKERKIRENA